MQFNIITLFPDFFINPLETSLIKKALERKLITVNVINLRDFTDNKHRQCDDTPYGGGCGMVLMIEPLYNAITYIRKKYKDTYIVYLSPQGEKITQKYIKKVVKQRKNITLLCGHYEGIDNRIIENFIDEEISIGDYILSGGETASLVFLEAVSRLVPGVAQKKDSIELDSFSGDLLKYPQYTKPESFKGLRVPKILLSGNHPEIKKWRFEKQIEITQKKNPNLYKKFIKRGKKK